MYLKHSLPPSPAAPPPCPSSLQLPPSAQAQLSGHFRDTAREGHLTLEPTANLHPSKAVLSHPVLLSLSQLPPAEETAQAFKDPRSRPSPQPPAMDRTHKPPAENRVLLPTPRPPSPSSLQAQLLGPVQTHPPGQPPGTKEVELQATASLLLALSLPSETEEEKQ